MTLTQGHLDIKIYGFLRNQWVSIKVCEYSRSMSFYDHLRLQDQASGERSQDQWSSGLLKCLISHVCLNEYVSDIVPDGHENNVRLLSLSNHYT